MWDSEERRILLLDSLDDLVKSTHAARLRRIMLRGGTRAQAQHRLPLVRQQDQVSCGLFALFYCCFIVRNPTTWRETIGAATFRVEDMREWLAALMVDGAHAAFTLDQLPAFVPAEANQSSEIESLPTENSDVRGAGGGVERGDAHRGGEYHVGSKDFSSRTNRSTERLCLTRPGPYWASKGVKETSELSNDET